MGDGPVFGSGGGLAGLRGMRLGWMAGLGGEGKGALGYGGLDGLAIFTEVFGGEGGLRVAFF